MCNAHNHPFGCKCGFGGDGHKGQRSDLFENLGLSKSDYGNPKQVTDILSRKREYDTYVNPNATCPVCGQSVYFYKSPDGGQVYFDELGPPWPKHPCTDNQSHKSYQKIVSRSWKLDGWHPAHLLKSVFLKFSFVLLDTKELFEVNMMDLELSSELEMSGNLFFINPESETIFKLHYFNLLKSNSRTLECARKSDVDEFYCFETIGDEYSI